MSELEVKGLADLQRALQDLPVKIERNVMRGAVNAGGQVFRKEARAGVPVKSGDLRNSIRVSVRVSTKAGRIDGTVKAGDRKAFYASCRKSTIRAHAQSRSCVQRSTRPGRQASRRSRTTSASACRLKSRS